MIFNYKEFIEELKFSKRDDNKATYNAWLNNKGKMYYEKEKFYKFHLKIKPIKYRVPSELEGNFDYNLLLRLVAISVSSSYSFVFPDPEKIDQNEDIDMSIPDLIIHVDYEHGKVSVMVRELRYFQINRLYEIYFSEIIHLWNIRQKSGGKNAIVDLQLMKKIREYEEKANIANKQAERINCFTY